MLAQLKKLFPNPLSYIGWGFIVLGVICIILAIQLGGDQSTISQGYGIGSFALAFISIGIAFHSMAHAEEFDKKMNSIGKANFIHVDSNLKTMTQNSIDRLIDKRNRWFTILSWRTGAIETERLRNFANDGERDSLAYPFTTIMQEIPWRDNRLTRNNRVSNSEVIWIIDIYRLIITINPSGRTLEELQRLFYDNIAPLGENENFNQLLDRVQAHLRGLPENDLFQRIE